MQLARQKLLEKSNLAAVIGVDTQNTQFNQHRRLVKEGLRNRTRFLCTPLLYPLPYGSPKGVYRTIRLPASMHTMSGIASGHSLRSGRRSFQSRLLVPLSCKPAFFVLMAPGYGMASLLSCASYLGRFPTHSIIVLKLFFLTVLQGVGSASEFLQQGT